MSIHHICKVNCGGTACEAPGPAVQFRGHLRPDAMERIEQAKTLSTRARHDEAFVIQTSTSLQSRFLRWVAGVLRSSK